MGNLITDKIKENIGFNDFILYSGQIYLGKEENCEKIIDEYKKLIKGYKNRNYEYSAKINEIMSMDDNLCEASAHDVFLRLDIEIEERNELKKKYEKTLLDVENWNVPEEYYDLKKFIIERIKKSINFDCFDCDIENKKLNGREWQKIKVEKLISKIKYNEEAIVIESESCKRYREWVNKLKNSLEN